MCSSIETFTSDGVIEVHSMFAGATNRNSDCRSVVQFLERIYQPSADPLAIYEVRPQS